MHSRLLQELLGRLARMRLQYHSNSNRPRVLFSRLPDLVLERIATFVAPFMDRQSRSVNRLAARLIHPRFTPHVTRLHFRNVQLGPSRSSDEDFDKLSKLATWLAETPSLASGVRSLHIEAPPDFGGILGIFYDACAKLLQAIAPTLEELHLKHNGGVVPFNRQILVLPVLPALNSLTVADQYLAVLPRILRCTPVLQSLRLCKYSWGHLRAPWLAVYDGAPGDLLPHRLQKLIIQDASGMPDYIRSLPIRTAHLYLTVHTSLPTSLFTIAEGVGKWRVFQDLERITIRSNAPNHRRLSFLAAAVQSLNIPVEWTDLTPPVSPLMLADGHPLQ